MRTLRCGMFDHRSVANVAMATAVFGGFSAHNTRDVLSSHRASELTGQSPLPLLAPAQSLTDGERGGRMRWIRGRRKYSDEFDDNQSEKHEQINS